MHLTNNITQIFIDDDDDDDDDNGCNKQSCSCKWTTLLWVCDLPDVKTRWLSIRECDINHTHELRTKAIAEVRASFPVIFRTFVNLLAGSFNDEEHVYFRVSNRSSHRRNNEGFTTEFYAIIRWRKEMIWITLLNERKNNNSNFNISNSQLPSD